MSSIVLLSCIVILLRSVSNVDCSHHKFVCKFSHLAQSASFRPAAVLDSGTKGERREDIRECFVYSLYDSRKDLR